MKLRLYFCAIGAALLLGLEAALAQLSGHGGPVRALAISADGKSVLSGSFDTRRSDGRLARIRRTGSPLSLRRSECSSLPTRWPHGHRGRGRANSDLDSGPPAAGRVFRGHRAPIVALAVSADDSTLASASWDGTVRLWPLHSGAKRVLEGHSQNVNGVAFAPDGKSLVSVGYDLTLRIWPLPDGPPEIITFPSPLNVVVIAADGEIATGGADGKVRFLSAGNEADRRRPGGSGPDRCADDFSGWCVHRGFRYRRRGVHHRSQGATA